MEDAWQEVEGTVAELLEALRLVKPGETLFIPARVELDFTGLVYAEGFVLHVPAGATLAGSRGSPGSSGTLLKSDAFQTSPLTQADGPGMRITGLRIRGPDPERRLEHWQRSFSQAHEQERGEASPRHCFYRLPAARGIATEADGLEPGRGVPGRRPGPSPPPQLHPEQTAARPSR